jgi:hypothetical protein
MQRLPTLTGRQVTPGRVKPATIMASLPTAILIFASWITPVSGQPDSLIRPYVATYKIEYNGKKTGTAELSVSYNSDSGRYTFNSSLKISGWRRLALPNTIVERSEFVSRSGNIEPLNFTYEDGRRRGDDNFHVLFDWATNTASISSEDETNQVQLVSAVLDRGSLQVQLMIDMFTSRPIQRYTLVDEDGLLEYGYRRGTSEHLSTTLGEFKTDVLIQERAGSSRQTWMWMAPELNFLPARIEQKRNGETRSALLLEAIEWTETGAGP